MTLRLVQMTLVVREYDEAIDFFISKLNFILIEDKVLSDTKRWVVISPNQTEGTRILLAKAANEEQLSRVGNQTGGRVFLFLHTDNFYRDFEAFRSNGVEFVRMPVEESWGTVGVFRDLYGNLWDLIEPS